MYKHRDNMAYAPTTVDPTGQGQRMFVTPLVNPGASTGTPSTGTARPSAATLAPTVAGARKRGRDIRGIDRFRQVVYGENGFPRLHAMATRSPVLMYPPEGIAEARQRCKQRREHHEEQRASVVETNGGVVGTGPRARSVEADDEALSATFDAHHRADNGMASCEKAAQADVANARASPLAESTHTNATDANAAPNHAAADARRDEQLATYHHQQLDVFLRMVYEFNHTTFVKLPMQDTLSLLSRCAKEAVAHVLEYETGLRMAREGKLRELKELRELKDTLRKRMEAVERSREERVLVEAEHMQAALDGSVHDGNDGFQAKGDLPIRDIEADADVSERQRARVGGYSAPALHVCFLGREGEPTVNAVGEPAEDSIPVAGHSATEPAANCMDEVVSSSVGADEPPVTFNAPLLHRGSPP